RPYPRTRGATLTSTAAARASTATTTSGPRAATGSRAGKARTPTSRHGTRARSSSIARLHAPRGRRHAARHRGRRRARRPVERPRVPPHLGRHDLPRDRGRGHRPRAERPRVSGVTTVRREAGGWGCAPAPGSEAPLRDPCSQRAGAAPRRARRGALESRRGRGGVPRARRGRAIPSRREGGFALLGVLVAFTILSLAVVAAIQGFAGGLRLLRLAGEHQQAIL